MKLDDTRYVIRQHGLWRGFTIFDSQGTPVYRGDVKGFSLRDEICLRHADDPKRKAIILVARGGGAFRTSYEVTDAETETKLGTIRGRGLSALAREALSLVGPDGQEIGQIREDSLALSLLRRVIRHIIPVPMFPLRYEITVDDILTCRLELRLAFPFLLLGGIAVKVELDFGEDFAHQLDKRLGLAAGVLLFEG